MIGLSQKDSSLVKNKSLRNLSLALRQVVEQVTIGFVSLLRKWWTNLNLNKKEAIMETPQPIVALMATLSF